MTTTNEGTQRDELAEIKARAEAATEGPWTPQEYDDNPGDQGVPIIGGGELGSMQGHLVAYAMTLSDEAQCEADGEFIAHARTDIPKLLAALEAALVLSEQWRYKGEFGWGAWQEGHGPDPEGTVLDDASAALRGAIAGAFE